MESIKTRPKLKITASNKEKGNLIEKEVPADFEGLLRSTKQKEDVRVTTYIEEDLHKVLIRLKKSGISIKKVINAALGDFLKKYNQF